MIPKIIHYIWLGGKEEPPILEKCKKSWKKFCPDYEIKRWDESNLDLSKYKFAKDAYEARKFAFASDVFRFDILNQEGGIYLDIDVELYKPLNEFLEFDWFMGFESESILNPGLIMGATPNYPALDRMLEIYKNTTLNLSDLQNQTICILTTNFLVKNYGLKQNNTTQFFDENKIAIFSTEYFCPKSVADGKIRKTKNTVSIHWYNMSWYSPWQKTKHYVKIILNAMTFGLFNKILMSRRKKKNTIKIEKKNEN